MTLRTILVEDSATIRDSLVPALVEFADAEVLEIAETAEDGIGALRRHGDRWHLAVVDVFLKQGNGLEVLRAVRQRTGHQRVVVLTNYATVDIRGRAMAAGADAVFDKSTELEQFLDFCASHGAQKGADGEP